MIENIKSLESTRHLRNRSTPETRSNENQKFISQVNHNLKNPFSTLLGFLDLLEEDFNELSEKEKKFYISEIKKSAKLSYKFNERFFEWLYFISNKTTLSYKNHKLFDLINEVVSQLPNDIKNKCSINLSIDQNIYIYSDEETIKKAIYYILENSINYSHANQSIIVESIKLQQKVIVKFIDEGIGISENNINSLFDISKSSNINSSSEEKGTGLSLILSKLFIEANRGKIWVESKKGVGSTFLIELPIIN